MSARPLLCGTVAGPAGEATAATPRRRGASRPPPPAAMRRSAVGQPAGRAQPPVRLRGPAEQRPRPLQLAERGREQAGRVGVAAGEGDQGAVDTAGAGQRLERRPAARRTAPGRPARPRPGPARGRRPTTGTSRRPASRRGRRTAATWRRALVQAPARAQKPAATACACTGAPVQCATAAAAKARSSAGSPRGPDELQPLRHPDVAGVRLADPLAQRRALVDQLLGRRRAGRAAAPGRPRRVCGQVAVPRLAEAVQDLRGTTPAPASKASDPCSEQRVASSSSPSRVRAPWSPVGLGDRDDLPGDRARWSPVPGVHSTSCRASRQASRVAGSPTRPAQLQRALAERPRPGAGPRRPSAAARGPAWRSAAPPSRAVHARRRRRAPGPARRRPRPGGRRTGPRAGRPASATRAMRAGSPARAARSRGVPQQAAGVDGSPGPGEGVGLGEQHVDELPVVDGIGGRRGTAARSRRRCAGGLAERQRRAVGRGRPQRPADRRSGPVQADRGDEVPGQLGGGDLPRRPGQPPLQGVGDGRCRAGRPASHAGRASVSRSRSCGKRSSPPVARRACRRRPRRPRPRRRPAGPAPPRARRAAAPDRPPPPPPGRRRSAPGSAATPPVDRVAGPRPAAGRRRVAAAAARSRASSRTKNGCPPVRRCIGRQRSATGRAGDPLDQLPDGVRVQPADLEVLGAARPARPAGAALAGGSSSRR